MVQHVADWVAPFTHSQHSLIPPLKLPHTPPLSPIIITMVTRNIPTKNMPTGKLRTEKNKNKTNSEMLTSNSREPPGLELKIFTRSKQATNRNNVAT